MLLLLVFFEHALTDLGIRARFGFKAATTPVKKEDLSKVLYIGWVNQANVVNYEPATVKGEGIVESTIPKEMAGFAFTALNQAEHSQGCQ